MSKLMKQSREDGTVNTIIVLGRRTKQGQVMVQIRNSMIKLTYKTFPSCPWNVK
jgi:hypothetical protein